MKKLLVLIDRKSNHVLFAALEHLREYYDITISLDFVKDIGKYDCVIARDVFGGKISNFLLANRVAGQKRVFILRGVIFPSPAEIEMYDYILHQTQWVANFLGLPPQKKIHAYGVDVRHGMIIEPKTENTTIQCYQYDGQDKISYLQHEKNTYVIKTIDLYDLYAVLLKTDGMIVHWDIFSGLGENIILQARAAGITKFQFEPNNMRLHEICNLPMKNERDYASLLLNCIATPIKRNMALVYEKMADNFYDGFWRAVDILKETYNVEMIDILADSSPNLENYHIVLVKTGFTSNTANYVSNYYKTHKKPQLLGICISSVLFPTEEERTLYDVMFYETEWYKNYALLDPNISYHAFGYDALMYRPLEKKIQDIDHLMVGSIVGWKRPLLLLEKEGKKVAIGDGDKDMYDKILAQNDVEVIGFMNPKDLMPYFARAKKCFIGATFYGGGERMVLDCRAMGIEVEIMPDNSKLAELLTSKLWDHHYYAQQLIRGIEGTLFRRK